MKSPIFLSLSLFLFSSLSFAAPSSTEQDIKNVFGMVPTFLKSVPSEALPGVWAELKGIELNETSALSGKVKSLIGIAVAAQVPCRYCNYFDKKSAKMNGASQKEINEAIFVAANTRHWSTALNGSQINEATFNQETDRIIKTFREKMAAQKSTDKSTVQPMSGATAATEPMSGVEAVPSTGAAVAEKTATPTKIINADVAYQDMEKMFGFVPTFLKNFSKEGIPGAWTTMRDFQMSSSTALSLRDKELIGLAVAAQVPCKYCVYFHTEAAKLNGATQNEIQESLAVASLTRQWSTFLNGQEMNEQKYRQEVDKIFKFMEMKNKGHLAEH